MPPGAPGMPGTPATAGAAPDELQALLELAAKQDALRAATEANTATLRDVQRLWGHNPGVSHQAFLAPGAGGVFNRSPGPPAGAPPLAPPKASGPEVSAVQANTRALGLVARGLDAAARAGVFAARLGLGTAVAVPAVGARAGAELAREGGNIVARSGFPSLVPSPFEAVSLGAPVTAERFTQAANDLKAVIGRDLAPVVEGLTAKVRALADGYVGLDTATHKQITTAAELTATAITAGLAVAVVSRAFAALAANPLVAAAMVGGVIAKREFDERASAEEARRGVARIQRGEGTAAEKNFLAPEFMGREVADRAAGHRRTDAERFNEARAVQADSERAIAGIRAQMAAYGPEGSASRAVARTGDTVRRALTHTSEYDTLEGLERQLHFETARREGARKLVAEFGGMQGKPGGIIPQPFRGDVVGRMAEVAGEEVQARTREMEQRFEATRRAQATGKTGREFAEEFQSQLAAVRVEAKAQPPAAVAAHPQDTRPVAAAQQPGNLRAVPGQPVSPFVPAAVQGAGPSFGASGFAHAGLSDIESAYRNIAEIALRSPLQPGQAPVKDDAVRTAEAAERIYNVLMELIHKNEGKPPEPPNNVGPLNIRPF